MECGAKKRDGTPCRAPAMANGRCRIHGGKTPNGFALPQTKSGRYSKYLPQRLVERYETATQDTELLAMKEDIALLDARLSDLLRRVDTGEAGTAWREARTAYRKVVNAIRAEDGQAIMAGMDELDNVLGRGASDYAAWNEIQSILEQRRRLVESEQKRLVMGQQMVTTEEATILIAALLDAIHRSVNDPGTLSTIQTEFNRLLGRPDRQRVITPD